MVGHLFCDVPKEWLSPHIVWGYKANPDPNEVQQQLSNSLVESCGVHGKLVRRLGLDSAPETVVKRSIADLNGKQGYYLYKAVTFIPKRFSLPYLLMHFRRN